MSTEDFHLKDDEKIDASILKRDFMKNISPNWS